MKGWTVFFAVGVTRSFSLLAAAGVVTLAWTSGVSGQSMESLPLVAQSVTVADLPATSFESGDVGTSSARPSAAGAHAKAGWAFLQAGNYGAANEAFSRAAELAPEEASVLVGLGLSYQLLGKDEQAITTLEQAIHLDMSAAQAHELLGDLYAGKEDLERAIHHYRLALRQDPRDVTLERRLELTKAEYRAGLAFDRLHSGHFQVKFRASATDARLAHRIVDRLEGVYYQVGEVLSSYPRSVFTVIVYPDREFWEMTESPRWARGLFDGVIHLPVQAARGDSRVAHRLLRHEYTHALVDQLSAGRAPVWLSEGLALHLEGQQERHEDVLKRYDTNTGVAGWTFHREFIALPPRDAQAAYAHSYRATHALIQQYGLGRVRALLESLSRTSDFSQAFETVFEVPFEDFEAEWLHQPVGQRF